MKIVACFLFATTLAVFVIDVNGECDEESKKMCLITFRSDASKDKSCKPYDTYASCLKDVCPQDLIGGLIFDGINKVNKDFGLFCSSGTNIKFSLTLALAAISFLNFV